MDSPSDYSREEYAALPVKAARALRRKWGQSPEQRATTPNGAPYPLRSWPPDAAIDIQALAEWSDAMKPETVRRFADEAARDAAIPAPTDGMVCWLQDVRQQQTRIGGQWLPTGGNMPWCFVTWPGSTIPAQGWIAYGAAPDNIQSGGLAWQIDPATGAVTLPLIGDWAMSLYLRVPTLANGTAYAFGLSADGVPITDASVMGNGGASSGVLAVPRVYSGSVNQAIRPIFNTGGTIPFETMAVNMRFLGPAMI